MSHVYSKASPRSRAILLRHVPDPGRFGKGVFVYSIDGLIPTCTTWCNCLVYDDRGDVPGIHYLYVTELARISGLGDEDTLGFRLQCSPRDAHCYLGNAIPGGTYYHLYDSIQQSLRPPDVLNPTGQPIDDDVPISSLIQVFQDRDIPLVFDPTKAKLPLRRNGILVPTKSSQRYDSYSSATTTKQYFERHCGTAGEARRDFYHDLRHRVFTITDDTYL